MAHELFRAKAPGIMSKLIADFGLDALSAAAILGNLGHECAGFTALQEIKPTVAGSRGGYGWAQWTGPRRRAFEAYCAKHKLDPASDAANYAFLWLELSGIEGTEGGAIPALKRAVGLDTKVEAFERAFLRAGVKHYDSRKAYARQALDAFRAVASATGTFEPPPVTPGPPPVIDAHPAPAPSEPGGGRAHGILIAVAVVAVIAIVIAAVLFR